MCHEFDVLLMIEDTCITACLLGDTWMNTLVDAQLPNTNPFTLTHTLSSHLKVFNDSCSFFRDCVLVKNLELHP